MNRLLKEDFKNMIQMAGTAIIENEMYLCELDRFVGDGDHGVTAARGFRAVRDRLSDIQYDYDSISGLLTTVSEILSESMGGAIGPIFGSIFEGAAEAAEGKNEITLPEFAEMMNSGLENVMLIGGAKEGDRTLVDCLAPAVRALEEQAVSGNGLLEALTQAVQKAEEGVEATKGMTAKKGRAKFLGEKSAGYQDAGATSMLLVLKAMKEYCTK